MAPQASRQAAENYAARDWREKRERREKRNPKLRVRSSENSEPRTQNCRSVPARARASIRRRCLAPSLYSRSTPLSTGVSTKRKKAPDHFHAHLYPKIGISSVCEERHSCQILGETKGRYGGTRKEIIELSHISPTQRNIEIQGRAASISRGLQKVSITFNYLQPAPLFK